MATSPDLETIQADLESLKRDLAALMSHLKSGAQDRIGGAANQVGDEATRLYGIMAEQGDRSMKALQRQVQEQPLLFLLGAFAVGYLGGRVATR